MATGLPYQRNRTYIPRITPPASQDLNDLQDIAVAQWASGGGLGGLGDGSDGDPVCNGVNAFAWATLITLLSDGITRYRLTRDIYVNTITVTGANVAVETNGFRIYHRGKAKATGGSVGFICNGVYGSGLVDGGTAGNIGTILSGGAGGNGVAAAAGNLGTGQLLGMGGAGGAGGAGPAHAAGAGGVIATSAIGLAQNPGLRIYTPHLFGYLAGAGFGGAGTFDLSHLTVTVTAFGGGGGGGAGGDSGGQGGAGAGLLAMAGLELELDTAMQVQAKGGNGAAGQGANSGGGGGGGGGGILLAESLITILDGTSIVAANNCPGGAAGAGTGTGAAGTAGTAGAVRIIVLRQPKTAAAAAPIVPTALPAVYFEPLPDPANFPLYAVIVDATTKSLMITLDNLTWQALT